MTMSVATHGPKNGGPPGLSMLAPPTCVPMLAVTHRLAAVVSPNTFSPFVPPPSALFHIVPAPRKPTPETICAATREVS